MKSIKDLVVKKIPPKNYYIVLGVSILIIVLCLYIRTFYFSYKANQVNASIFSDKAINQINESDLNFAINETGEAILYVSYVGPNRIKNMEKKLMNEIENNDIKDKIIYFNVTELRDNNEYIKILKNEFPSIKDNIKKCPMLIYIKDGQAVEVFDSSNKMINKDTLKELLTKYGIV